MLTLHLYLLGEFRLVYADSPLPAGLAPRAQAFLTYLLLHRGAHQPRQRIAFRLWPDSSETQARTNLRKQVHQVRHALPDADAFLVDDGTTLQWRHDAPFTLDVADFEQAVAMAEHAGQAGDQTAVRAALEQALSLYRGTLLPDCYDDWLLSERERLHQMYLTAAEQLIRVLDSVGNYRQAIGHAQRLLQADPVHEATYCHLMRLHALSGDRAGAVRVYRTCVAVLERELGIEPAATTRELYARLRQAEVLPRPPVITDAPPAARRTHNLPLPLTSFIGRARELAEVERLQSSTRLLTLTGAGGSGKTRLALQVAAVLVEVFPDGVCWVELAALKDPALVPQTLAATLGVQEQPGQPLVATLADDLRAKELLVLLDNCEHLVAACARLAEALLRVCPKLRILATSREALGIAGETTWLVLGLSLPAPERGLRPEELARFEAVRLFVERAQAAMPTFRLTERNARAVAQVCRRLDGIPLAIELAAARVKVLAVEQIATRLDDALRLLTGSSRTAVPRHQTLQTAIDWSYELLSEPERALLRRLAVFAGGFTLDAVEAVCQGESVASGDVLDLLAHLVDKSLVLVREGEKAPRAYAEARYHLLETVRQYAWHRLYEAGEAEGIQRQHAHFFLLLAERAEPQLTGADEALLLGRLETEHDNLRAVLAWALERGEAAAAARLAAAVWRFWEAHSHLSEGRRWLEAALADSDALTPPIRAKALIAAGNLAWNQCDYAAACAFLDESLALRRALGDTRGIAEALNSLGGVAQERGDYAAARTLLEESLALRRDVGDTWGIAVSLNNLGNVAHVQGDYAAARTLFEESLTLARELGQKRFIATLLNNLGDVAYGQDDYVASAACHHESLTIRREVGDKPGIAYSLHNLGVLAREQADYAAARDLYAEAIGIYHEAGDRRAIAEALEEFATMASAQAQAERAVRLAGAAVALREAIGAPPGPAAQARLERWLELAHRLLPRETSATVLAQGKAMSLEQAIAYALETSPLPDPPTRLAGHRT